MIGLSEILIVAGVYALVGIYLLIVRHCLCRDEPKVPPTQTAPTPAIHKPRRFPATATVGKLIRT